MLSINSKVFLGEYKITFLEIIEFCNTKTVLGPLLRL